MHKKLYEKIKKEIRAENILEDDGHSRFKMNNPRGKTALVDNIPFLFTCDEKNKLVCRKNHSIVVENGIIVKIAPAKKITGRNFDIVYDAGKRGGIVVTPGFINAHSHPPMYLLRSAMTLDEGESIDKTIAAMPEWERAMTDEDYAFATVGDLTEQQKSGVTTTLSHYAVYAPIEAAARATKHNIINAVSVASNTHPQNSPELIRKIIQKKEDNWESQLAMALHYVHRGNDKIFREVKKLSEKYNLLFTCHMAESESVAKRCVERHGLREVALLEKYGLLNERTVVSHAIYINEKEIEKLIENQVGVVHLPTSNVIHKSGTFPLWKFFDLEKLSSVALGTDGVVSKSRLDLLTEAYQTRITHLYSRTVKFGTLFKMMTVNGARVLNMPDRGKILPGMKADLAFWKLKDRGFIPFDEKNPMTLLGNLITHGGRIVRDLMINGRFVVKGRRHQRVDESKLLQVLQKRHMKMRRRVARKKKI
ncbi:MAG: Amidohydro-rel protein [Patescibacteria group bacterium]|nr:Amidohydro-rel protein [Patescibacteria group bacterium]